MYRVLANWQNLAELADARIWEVPARAELGHDEKETSFVLPGFCQFVVPSARNFVLVALSVRQRLHASDCSNLVDERKVALCTKES